MLDICSMVGVVIIICQDKIVYFLCLGLIYLFMFVWLVYVSVSKFFCFNSGSDVSGNVFSFEILCVVEVGLKFQSEDQCSGVMLVVFDIIKQNVLIIDLVNVFFLIVVGEVCSKGVELDVNVCLGYYWWFIGNLVYIDVYVSKDNILVVGLWLINVFCVLGSVLVVFEDVFVSGLFYGIGGGLNYVGNCIGDQVGSFKLFVYVMVCVLVYWQFMFKMKLLLDVNNFFNKWYYSSFYSNVWIMLGDECIVMLVFNVKF